eukprot:TRINITY_DN25753_c0_g1_i1.p1 TRINITY_DN25753_c0_g1~~TRINITY_DN25753_c0_g1_i1.p1  ORF type:complete len:181 (+),score=17.71 TRINITY_DN25753_c0_g1_i1:37-543(+)
MKTMFASAVLLALAACVSAITTVDMCPNRCNADRTNSDNECNHAVTRGVCAVSPCSPPQNGFACEMPQDSFIIANTHLPLVELVVEYSWGSAQSDLDTSTRFLDGNVGYSCSPNTPYLDFGGDDTFTTTLPSFSSPCHPANAATEVEPDHLPSASAAPTSTTVVSLPP